MGLFEIHCHTSNVSSCGWVDADKVVRIHKEEGYEGICITEHYHELFFSRYPGLSDDEIVEKFLSGYRIAKKTGDEIGLKVFWGMEIRFPENSNDYLVYGLTEDMLFDNPHMYRMGLESFSNMCRINGLLLIQAHPFRDNMVRVNPVLLDGLEVYNGNKRHNSRNDTARVYASENDMIEIGGGDFHRECDVNQFAMEFLDEINSIGDIVNSIKSGSYTVVESPFT